LLQSLSDPIPPPADLARLCKPIADASPGCNVVPDEERYCDCSLIARIPGKGELAEMAVLFMVSGYEIGPGQQHFLALRGPGGWQVLGPPIVDLTSADGAVVLVSGLIPRVDFTAGADGHGPALTLEVVFVEDDIAPYLANDPEAAPPEPGSPDYDVAVETRTTTTLFCWLDDGQPSCVGLPTSGVSERYLMVYGEGGEVTKGEVKARSTWERPASFAGAAIRVAPVAGVLPAGIAAAPAELTAKDAARHRAFKAWKVLRPGP
jgi:hypothetical protein